MSQQNNDSQLFLLAYDSLDDERRKTPIRTQVFSKGVDIGRDFHSEVYLSSETVSARHAKIEYNVETNRWAIVDLNSRNGVIHNGVRVTRQDLKNGDRIQLGEALLVVQIRTDHNERTKSFSFSPNRLAPPDA